MRLAGNEQMRELDRVAIEKYGVPGVVLMENAGRAVVGEILKSVPQPSSIIILCGTGNNGGDGFVVARHLMNRNIPFRIFIVGSPKEITGDALINLEILKKLHVTVDNINDINGLTKLEKLLPLQDVVVDALFGTGLQREVEGVQKGVIEIVNRLGKFVLSIDVPSGVMGDTGEVLGTAIEAHKTVTFVLPKCGNILYPGADYNGELVIRGIGLPPKLQDEVAFDKKIITEEMAKSFVPSRPKNSHKGTYGKANVIAGSSGLTGAAILTCRSALRSGLGLLKLYIPESLNIIITTSVPEAVTIPIQEMRKGVIGINQITRIIEETASADVVAIGPGCGTTSEMSELVKRMINEVEKPMIIDADGLNVLAKNMDVLQQKKADIILTPHPGEMSRMCGLTTEEINHNPVAIARKYAQEWGVILVLKGSRTVVGTPKGHVYVNTTGNPGMATAGTGDVLTGIITGFAAQGVSPLEAALLGVYCHGRSGDIMAKDKGEYGLLAGDIVAGLTYTLKEIVGRV